MNSLKSQPKEVTPARPLQIETRPRLRISMASTMDLLTIPIPSSPRVRRLSTGEIKRSIKEKSLKRLKNSSNGKELKMFSQALITLSSARTESTSTTSSREISVTVGSCQLLLLSLSSQAVLRASSTTTIPSTVTVSMVSTCML